MAGYGVEPTPERPRSDACDRPLLAGFRLMRQAYAIEVTASYDRLHATL
jgi:hypothetical protein